MDTQSLFNKKTKKPASERNLIFAAGNELDDLPLTHVLTKNQNVKIGGDGERFELISNGAVDIGFISTIDFARLKGGWKIFPGICKYTLGPSHKMALFFNSNLTELTDVAVQNETSTATVLLKILLNEKFEIDVDFHQADGELPVLLNKYDAVLLSGDKALKAMQEHASFIDLGEEWYDLTESPFVYGFWIGNELTAKHTDQLLLLENIKKGIPSNLSKKESLGLSQKLTTDYLENVIKYNYGEKQENALIEFFKYAFFYGLTDYVPDLKFFTAESG